jgi:hypothetical protein
MIIAVYFALRMWRKNVVTVPGRQFNGTHGLADFVSHVSLIVTENAKIVTVVFGY